MKGIVVKSTGSWYSVRMDSGEVMECRIKGKLYYPEIDEPVEGSAYYRREC